MPRHPLVTEEWGTVTLSATVKKYTYKNKYLSIPRAVCAPFSSATLVSQGFRFSSPALSSVYIKTPNATSASFWIHVTGLAGATTWPIVGTA